MKLLLVNNTKSAFNAINQSINDSSINIIISEGQDNVISEIHSHDPQIVLINWTSDDIDIPGICRKIRRVKSGRYIYIIIIAAREKEKYMTSAIKAGADDFIFKPFGKEELSLRIMLAKNNIKREEQVYKSRKNLIKFAKEDPATNLLNRRALLDEALMEMGRASREQKFFSSIMINVNNLKDIVESGGNVLVNSLLLEISKLLRKQCRSYDKIGRYGISQFLILPPDAHVEQAESFSERLLNKLKKAPLKANGKTIDLNLAIGISELNPDRIIMDRNLDEMLTNDMLLDSLIKRTEEAMQKAAEKGSNAIYMKKER